MMDISSDKKIRVLWLINHQTLIEFEPGLIQDLGFEVFIPKLFPQNVENRSGKVTYEFDRSLTIPQEDLDALNSFNFYTTRITPRIRKILNEYFSIVIVPSYALMVQQIIQSFEGLIILRGFGHMGKESYSNILCNIFPGFESCIKRLGERFIFSMAYKNMDTVEKDFFLSHAVYMPLGIPKSFFQDENTWIGDDKRIFFICPAINASPFYTQIYNEFKKNFKGFQYLIGGKQYVKVDDSHVTGTLKKEDLISCYQHLAVMFYHSKDPRHLFYHPLEAMTVGMPVVFMQESLLGSFDTDLPGACRDVTEAKKKIRAILSGDLSLIRSIRESQKKILEHFTFTYCFHAWNEVLKANFIPALKAPIPKNPRIAVFLLQNNESSFFNSAKTIAMQLQSGSRRSGTPIEVVFSVIEGMYPDDELADIIECGIEIRETHWETIDHTSARKIFEIEGVISDLSYQTYILPRDHRQDFLDCDLWLIVSDNVSAPILPIKRYGVVIYDCLYRYFTEYQNPDYEMPRIMLARGADFILTTTPYTREDVISFFGISPDRVFLAPIDYKFEGDLNRIRGDVEEYILWSTNANIEKNHFNAIEAIRNYYSSGGQFSFVITGFGSQVFDIEYDYENENRFLLPHIITSRELLLKYPELKGKIRVLPYLSNIQYYQVLKKSAFVFHPVTIDNGTYSVLDAAVLGIPSLSADYPQMRYIDEQFNLGLTFCNQHSPKDMGFALLDMENQWREKKRNLPPVENILHNGDESADKLWRVVRELI